MHARSDLLSSSDMFSAEVYQSQFGNLRNVTSVGGEMDNDEIYWLIF